MKRTMTILCIAGFGILTAAGQRSETLTGELKCIDCDAAASLHQNQTKSFASSNGKLYIRKQYTWSDARALVDYCYKMKLTDYNDTDSLDIGDSNGNSSSGYLEIELDNNSYYKGYYTIYIEAEAKDKTYYGTWCKDTDTGMLCNVTLVNENFTFDTETQINSPGTVVSKFDSVTVSGTVKAEPPYSGANWEAVSNSTPVSISASNGSWSGSATVYTSNGQFSKTFPKPILGWDTNDDWTCTATMSGHDTTSYGANTSYAYSTDSVSAEVSGMVAVIDDLFDSGLAAWESIDLSGNGGWADNFAFGRDNFTGGGGGCATIDSEFYGGVAIDAALVSQVFSACPDSTAEFQTDFRWFGGRGNEKGDVDIAIGDGPWQNLLRFEGGDFNGPISLDLSAYAGEQARIRFHYYDAFEDRWWQIDNVLVTGVDIPLGACCFPDGSCTNLTEEGCALNAGHWIAGEDCNNFPCPPPVGACCLPGGWCDDLSEADCISQGGDWYANEHCTDFVCPGDAPANDECADASPIADVTDLPFCTTHAIHDGIGTCMTGPNLWFCYTAPRSGIATVSLCGSRYDTMLAIYEGCDCDPLGPRLACNGDSPVCGAQSEWQFVAEAGQSYLIEVGGYENAAGPGLLTIVCEPVGACCLPDGVCAETTQSACVAQDGSYAGDGSDCWVAQCPGCGAPEIAVQPADAQACTGEFVYFDTIVQGTPPFFYQWQHFDADLDQWVDVPQAVEPYLAIEAAAPENSGNYKVLVSNYCGQVISDTVTLDIGTPEPLDNNQVRAVFNDFGTSGRRFAVPSLSADIAWLEVSPTSQLYSWEGNLRYDDGSGTRNHFLNDDTDFTIDHPACNFGTVVTSASHNGEFSLAATHWLSSDKLTTQLVLANVTDTTLTDVQFAWMLDADLAPPQDDPHVPCCANVPWLGFGQGTWNAVTGAGWQSNLNACAGIVPPNVLAHHTARMDDVLLPDEWTVSNPVGFQGATCDFDGPTEAQPSYRFERPFDNTDGIVGDNQDLAIVTNFKVAIWPAGASHTFVYTLKFTPHMPSDLDIDGDVDNDDLTLFAPCLSGPGVAMGGDCAKADLDADIDCDMHDFEIFQRAFTGAD